MKLFNKQYSKKDGAESNTEADACINKKEQEIGEDLKGL